MKRKITLSLLLCLVLLASLPVSALADDTLSHVTDACGVLTESELSELEQLAASVSAEYSCGVYAVFVPDYTSFVSGSISDFTEALYNSYNLGLGDDRNCIILAVSLDTHDYDIDAHGSFANDAFTDYGKECLADDFVPYLSDGDWAGGIRAFISRASELMYSAVNGSPVDTYVYDEPDDEPYYESEPQRGLNVGEILIVILAPCGISAAVCAAFAAQMKTARKATQANRYVSAEPRMSIVEDQFINRTETRRRIERDTSSSRGGGGGRPGGTTINSSGHSHRSGKF